MIPDFLPTWAKDALMIIGALTIIFTFIEILFKVVPQLNKTKTSLWKKIIQNKKDRHLIKEAIASDIETHVNEVVLSLQNELPSGWIKKASIDWVK